DGSAERGHVDDALFRNLDAILALEGGDDLEREQRVEPYLLEEVAVPLRPELLLWLLGDLGDDFGHGTLDVVCIHHRVFTSSASACRVDLRRARRVHRSQGARCAARTLDVCASRLEAGPPPLARDPGMVKQSRFPGTTQNMECL